MKNSRNEGARTILRAEKDGFDLRGLPTRTLNIAGRIYDEIDRRDAVRRGCVVNVSAICGSLAVSRSAVEHNPVLKAVIERHRTTIPNDAATQRYIDKLERELATLREWHKGSVEADLLLEKEREKYRQLQEKINQYETKAWLRNKEVLELRAERDRLSKQVEELQRLVSSGTFGGIGIGVEGEEP